MDTLLELLNELNQLEFTAHIYGHPSLGWFHKGIRLINAGHSLFGYVFDEFDKRIEVYQVTSSCGKIKGSAIHVV